MSKCHIYIKRSPAPILVMGYKRHKIKKGGYSIFTGMFYEYHVKTDDIEYFSIENVKGETDGEET